MTRQVLKLLPQLRSSLHRGSFASTTQAVPQLFLTRGFADDASLKKTPLYDFHVQNGGTYPTFFCTCSRKCSFCSVVECDQITHCTTQLETEHNKMHYGTHFLCDISTIRLLPAQEKWSRSQAGRCRSSTKTRSWTPLSTAGSTAPSLMCPTCAV